MEPLQPFPNVGCRNQTALSLDPLYVPTGDAQRQSPASPDVGEEDYNDKVGWGRPN